MVKIEKSIIFLFIFLTIIALTAYLTYGTGDLAEERFQGIFLIMLIHVSVVILIKQYKYWKQRGSLGTFTEF